MIRLVVEGRPATKKNSARIAYSPSGKPFVLPSEVSEAWTRDAVRRLREQYRGPRGPLPALTGPLHVTYRFVLAGRQWEGDSDNYQAAANDALQKAGIIANDKQICSWAGTKSYGTPKTARLELTIHAVEQEAAA